jgi:hypothetical protein
MSGDSMFRPERFTDRNLLRERTLSDCKRDIYRLFWDKKALQDWEKRNEWNDNGTSDTNIENSPKEGLAEFIRDVISIANAARLRGEPGYLLFGVEDSTMAIVGIEGQCANPSISLETHTQERINVLNERFFAQKLQEYVFPQVVFEYLRGKVEESLVAYLEIIPQATPDPYQVKTDLGEVKNPLRIGDCWVRQGESKGQPLSDKDKQYLYPWTEVPYIELDNWKMYLRQVEAGIETDIDKLENIWGYQYLRLKDGYELQNKVEEFIGSSISSNLLIIRGRAGSGKSVFLNNLASRSAQILSEELSDKFSSENINIGFQNPIPIFQSLRSFVIKPGDPLERELLNRLRRPNLLHFQYHANKPERLFYDHSKSWLIFLDGFDEISPDHRVRTWEEIDRIIRSYPNIKIILTSRPDISFTHQTAEQCLIDDLSSDQVIEYLRANLQPDEFDNVLDFLSTHKDLWSLFSVPLFLKTAASYFSGGAVSDSLDHTFPNLGSSSESTIFLSSIKTGEFLDRVYQRLWEHNQKKMLISMEQTEYDKTYLSLGKMAASMAQRRPALPQDEAEKYLGDDRLNWVLDLGILFLKRKSLVEFHNLLSQSYFASFFLKVLLESNSPELCNPIVDSVIFWQTCLHIVRDLTFEDTLPLEKCIEDLKGEY